MRLVLKILLAAFLIIPLLVAAALYAVSVHLLADAKYVQGETSIAFKESGPFMAYGKLVSPSGLTLKSPYQGLSCLAYRTTVARLKDTYSEDSEGNERVDTSRQEIHRQSEEVADLTVRFENGSAVLHVKDVQAFFQTFSDSLDDPPAFVPKDKAARPWGEWFEVQEDVFTPDQSVFVAATRKPDGSLGSHPGVRTLLIFPGTREQYVETLSQTGRAYRIAVAIVLAVSLLIAAVLAGILKATSPGKD